MNFIEVSEKLYADLGGSRDFSAYREKLSAAIAVGDIGDLYPRYAALKVCDICNSNCAYCGHASGSAMPKKPSPSFEKICDVLSQMSEIGVAATTISGGEPLLRDDIADIVAHSVRKKVVPILLTNGLTLGGKLDELYRAGLRFIIISIDTLDSEAYKLTRGVPVDGILRSLGALFRFKEAHADLHVHITSVLSRASEDGIEPLIDFFSARGISAQINPFHNFLEFDKDRLVAADFPKTVQLCDRLIAKKREGARIVSSDAFLGHCPDFLYGKRMLPEGFSCSAGYTNIYIDVSLNVNPCWDFYNPPVGNLYEHRLSDLWFGADYGRVRRDMQKNKCRGCWLLCTAECTIAFEDAKGDGNT